VRWVAVSNGMHAANKAKLDVNTNCKAGAVQVPPSHHCIRLDDVLQLGGRLALVDDVPQGAVKLVADVLCDGWLGGGMSWQVIGWLGDQGIGRMER